MKFSTEVLITGIFFTIALIASVVVAVLGILGNIYMNVFMWICLVFFGLVFLSGALLFNYIAYTEIKEGKLKGDNI